MHGHQYVLVILNLPNLLYRNLLMIVMSAEIGFMHIDEVFLHVYIASILRSLVIPEAFD